MNKAWISLIIIGIIFLVAAIGWEFYQVASGNRSTIDTTVLEYSSDSLFDSKLENHLKSDPNFVSINTNGGTPQAPTSFPVSFPHP